MGTKYSPLCSEETTAICQCAAVFCEYVSILHNIKMNGNWNMFKQNYLNVLFKSVDALKFTVNIPIPVRA